MISFRKPRRGQAGRLQRRAAAARDDSSSDGEGYGNDHNDGANGVNSRAVPDTGPDGDDDDDRSTLARIQAARKAKEQRSTKKLISSSSSTQAAAESKSKDSSTKTKTMLSFGDEEDEGEAFQIKKSSQSRRLMKQKNRAKPIKDTSTPPEQHQQHQQQQQQQQPPKPPLISRPAASPSPPADLAGITVKNSVQWSRTLTGREAEALHLEDEDHSSPSDSDSGDEGPSQGLRNLLSGGAIPDASAIHLARKKRQAARERGEPDPGGQSYIPINNEEQTVRTKKGGGRLQREEDEEDDGEEDRISFTGVKSSRRDREQQQEHLGHEVSSGENDSDEEGHNHWEEMQIRKAMKQSHISEAAAGNSYYLSTSNVSSSGSSGKNNGHSQPQQQQPIHKPLGPALAKPKAYNLQGIKDRLKGRLSSLNEVHRRHRSDLDRVGDELIESHSEIERLDTELPEKKDKHLFFQELKAYILDLTECYNEKAANIKYLEDKLNASKGSVCTKLMERRRQDIRDQMMELSSKPTQIAAGNNVAEVELAARQRRAAEREGRRRRRQQSRLQKQMYLKHNDGMSSDDELETLDQANLCKVRTDVESQARQVLSDVVDEYATIEGVMARFLDWRTADPDSYNDAFVSMCLPKIFSPLVRMQLLFWNPFSKSFVIESADWYKSLATYGLELEEDEADLAKDPDRKLVSLVVEKVLVPKLKGILECAYDPMSTSQTVAVTGLLKTFVSTYPTVTGNSKAMRDLLSLVKDKIKSCVEYDLYIPIGYSKQISECPSGAHAQFANRQFWSCFKLIENILSWHGLLGDGLLSELALTSALNRYLLIGLGINPDPVDAVAKARIVISALPKAWLAASGAFGVELERFAQFLSGSLGMSKKLDTGDVEDVANMLIYLGFHNEAQTLRRKRAA